MKPFIFALLLLCAATLKADVIVSGSASFTQGSVAESALLVSADGVSAATIDNTLSGIAVVCTIDCSAGAEADANISGQQLAPPSCAFGDIPSVFVSIQSASFTLPTITAGQTFTEIVPVTWGGDISPCFPQPPIGGTGIGTATLIFKGVSDGGITHVELSSATWQLTSVPEDPSALLFLSGIGLALWKKLG